MEIEGTFASKNLDETVCLQSKKRQELIRERRLQGTAEGASSVPCLASSSAALFPRRNECPRTHCSLIEQEDREDSSCQICQKSFIQKRERLLRGGPMMKQRYSVRPLRRGKNLAFSEDTGLEKERVRSKVIPRKVGVG